ncbi:MAG: hypothetical protein JSR46_11890, partial [Verrucomicrobia bacterium]|nr:hypothetical protein [Verrucomicrobiota bacterium]
MGNFSLGIDLMGADVQAASIIEAVLSSPRDCLADASILFFASTPIVEQLKEQFGLHLDFCPCSQVIEMDESPVRAVKTKTDATVVAGIKALKTGKIQAFISCASTGALVAASCLHLPKFPSVSKPALISLFPSQQGEVVVLDVGAIASTTSSQLVQHAFLGALYARQALGIEHPTVALLNIGSEPEKGDEETRKACQKLMQQLMQQETPFQFVGNKEPHDLFLGKANVFVTSGFVGNIFLKTAEASCQFVLERVKEKLAAAPAILDKIASELRAPMQQGAVLFGVQGLVIKCHGSANKASIQ